MRRYSLPFENRQRTRNNDIQQREKTHSKCSGTFLYSKTKPTFCQASLPHINNRTQILPTLVSVYTFRTSALPQGSLKYFWKFSGGISQTQSPATVPLPPSIMPCISIPDVCYSSWHSCTFMMPELDSGQQQSEGKCFSLSVAWHSSVPSRTAYASKSYIQFLEKQAQF